MSVPVLDSVLLKVTLAEGVCVLERVALTSVGPVLVDELEDA